MTIWFWFDPARFFDGLVKILFGLVSFDPSLVRLGQFLVRFHLGQTDSGLLLKPHNAFLDPLLCNGFQFSEFVLAMTSACFGEESGVQDSIVITESL